MQIMHCSNKKRHRDSIGQIMVCSKQTGFDIEVLLTSKPRKKLFSDYCGISPGVSS